MAPRKTQPKLNARQIEIAVANLFHYRYNLIVPNVSWGLPGLNHEADLLVVWPSHWAAEVEIKCCTQDINIDPLKKKWRWRHSDGWPHCLDFFKEFWMAIPKGFEGNPNIPDWAGIITVAQPEEIQGKVNLSAASVFRQPKRNPHATRLSDAQVDKLRDLVYLRVWTMKSHFEKEKRRSHSKQEMAGRDDISSKTCRTSSV